MTELNKVCMCCGGEIMSGEWHHTYIHNTDNALDVAVCSHCDTAIGQLPTELQDHVLTFLSTKGNSGQ